MEIKQLEVFACVARNLSFSKAAERMYLSQPTISSYISSLEKCLGVQLLVRNTKEVSLTKAGQDFLIYAQKILSLREQAMHSINGKNRDAQGVIDIISSTIPAQHLLPEIIASFQKQWPNIVFRLEQADSHRVEQEMGNFRYDFGMVGTIPVDDRFIRYPAYYDELVLVVPNNTPESAETIRDNFSDYITHVPFIMRGSGSGTRKEIETLLSKIGVNLRDLRIPAYFPDAHSILMAVSHGAGVSLISKVAAKMHVEAGLLTKVEMNNPLFLRQLYLLYNKELWLSTSQQAFADHVRHFYR